MWTVQNFVFPLKSSFDLDLPDGADILEVLPEKPAIVAHVSTVSPAAKRQFRLLKTGETVKRNNLQHVKSFEREGAYYHLFEVKT